MSADFERERPRLVSSNDRIGDAGRVAGALKGGDGGDNFGGDMEARIAKLEAQYEQMSKSLEKLDTSVDTLKTGQATLLERSQHLATKNYIGVVVVSSAVVLGVVLTAIKFLTSAP